MSLIGRLGMLYLFLKITHFYGAYFVKSLIFFSKYIFTYHTSIVFSFIFEQILFGEL